MDPIVDYMSKHPEAMKYVRLSQGASAFQSSFETLPHGDLAFQALFDAVSAAKTEIFLASWSLDPDLELVRTDWDKSTSARRVHAMDALLIKKAKTGVIVRGLIWNFLNLRFAPPTGNGSSGGGTTTPANPMMLKVRKLAKKLAAISPKNQLLVVEHPTPFATRTVLGVSFPLGGSHHQKIWITRSGKKHVAFVGGVNLLQGDWDTHHHKILDQRRNPQDMEGAERKRKEKAGEDPEFPPRHDWATRMEGPAAHRVLTEFRRRWGMAGKKKFPIVPFNHVPPAGKMFVQVSHTYPVAFGGGDFEILKVYEHAISKAKHYAYFENQYWTTDAVTTALVDRLKKEPKLQVVIVLPDKSEDPGGSFIVAEQWHQLSRLWAVAGTSRVRAYAMYKKHPSRAEYVNIYVHAKVAVIDDLWATIGSANTNNRSMILDTECNVQVAHKDLVTKIRKSAWREMLGGSDADNSDPVKAIQNGFHPKGAQNAKKMKDGKELDGLIVPLTKPDSTYRIPESLRPLL